MRRYLLFIAVILLTYLALPVQAQVSPREPLLIPIGGGNPENYPEFINAAIQNARQGKVNIIVLPINLASDSELISDSERSDVLNFSDNRRKEMEESCRQAVPKTLHCNVILAPILTRTDAILPSNLKLFNPDLSAIYILDGDKAIGVDVIGGTPVEYQLSRAYDQGVIIAGNGAGSVIQSNPMVGSYRADEDPSKALTFGSVEVWDTAEQHGLLFGIKDAMIEDRFFQDGNIGRLLNAISFPNVPDVGIGLDENTGVMIPSGDKLNDVFGRNTVTILDAASYGASDAVQYTGPKHLISLRNVLVHTLAPGDFSYDLTRKHHSLGAPYQQLDRTYDYLSLPPNAGPLLLTGDLINSSAREDILNHFTALSGDSDANILVLAGGYPTQTDAEKAGAEIANILGVDSQVSVIPNHSDSPIILPPGYTGIILTIADQSKVNVDGLTSLREIWQQGVPILADNGAVPLIGQYYSPITSIESDGERIEIFSRSPLIEGELSSENGLGFLNTTFVSRLMEDNRWGQLFTLAYHHPELLSVGLSQDSAIELTDKAARSLGDNVNVVLDFRKAILGSGTNDAFVIANGLMDVFAPGEVFEPAPADINSAPERLPTPILVTPSATPLPTFTPLPSLTPTTTITPTQSPVPTQRMKPTPTPIVIPPPSDPATRNMMVTFGVSIVIVIVLGIWVNRRRIN